MLWYDEAGQIQTLPALDVPRAAVVDTSGAGDVFHGAYVWSYLARPHLPWREHFIFARAASTYKIQHLGNEAGLPRIDDVERVIAHYPARM